MRCPLRGACTSRKAGFGSCGQVCEVDGVVVDNMIEQGDVGSLGEGKVVAMVMKPVLPRAGR